MLIITKALRVLKIALIWVFLSVFYHGLNALTSSDAMRTDVAALLGAQQFYASGINGAGATVAVIEGGLVWNEDPSLAHVTRYFREESTWSDSFGDERDLWDRHATWSGAIIGGRGQTPERTGIAPGVDLVSAATARRWTGTAYTSNWVQASVTVLAAYEQFTILEPVDVISSSWGFSDSAATNFITRHLDALAYDFPATLHVAAAGNGGFTTNTVLAPASGMNVLAVGGVAYSSGAYDVRWSSSGQGPSNYWDPVNGSIFGVRSSVDLLAPSQNLMALRYGGQTGGNNTTLSGSTNEATRDSVGLAGTSFAAPIVAGGAALLYSLSKETMPDNDESRDARVIKAVLMNSALKLQGWNNGSVMDGNGVLTTTQGLDFAQGAGRLNLDKAFFQYADLAGNTAGVAGLSADLLTSVGASGWDLATLGYGSSLFYEIGSPGPEGGMLTSTLTWYRQRTLVGQDQSTDLKQSNLDLRLWADIEGLDEWTLVAQSVSEFNLVEHLFVNLSITASYFIEVFYGSDTFALNGASEDEVFALAWNLAPIPEPAAVALLMGIPMLLVACLLRRRSTQRLFKEQ